MKTGMDHLHKEKKTKTSDRWSLLDSLGDSGIGATWLIKPKSDIGCSKPNVQVKGTSLVLTDILLNPFPISDLGLGQAGREEQLPKPFDQYLQHMRELEKVQEQRGREREPLEIMLREKDKQLERVTQEMNTLASRIQSVESQRRMDIAYALAAEDSRKTLAILARKVTLGMEEVAGHVRQSDVISVVCDLCKARLANLKGKKLIVTSLGLKVAKKLQGANE